jgi:hypothetical protein
LLFFLCVIANFIFIILSNLKKLYTEKKCTERLGSSVLNTQPPCLLSSQHHAVLLIIIIMFVQGQTKTWPLIWHPGQANNLSPIQTDILSTPSAENKAGEHF